MRGVPGRSSAVFLVLLGSALSCSAGPARKKEARPATRAVLGYAAGTAVATTLARADVAVMRSAVGPNLLKGGFGEAHMNRHLVGSLKATGNWTPLPARLGSQGIDGLFVRFDGTGRPSGLIVSEAKYGTSRLSQTADGIQMGARWRSVRLARMAGEYRSIARSIESGSMAVAGPGGSVGKQRLQIPLSDRGRVAVFARSRPGDPWEFVGPRSLLPRAGNRAAVVADHLRQASEGKVPYESPVYRVALKEGSMRVSVKDASRLGEQIGESALPVRRTVAIRLGPARLDQLRGMGRVEVAKILQRKYPHLASADADQYARAIVRTPRDFERLISSRPRTVGATVAGTSVRIGVGAGLFDAALQALGQYRETGAVDWGRVGLSSGITALSATAGAAAGQGAVVFLTGNPIAYQFMARSSTILGLGSRSLATNLLGGAVGGSVTTAFMAVGGYLAGYYDLQTASRMTIAGGAGIAAGAAFSTGLVAMATTFGTASTGTAIASLHGAALTSATGAWLGGGSLAAGGSGMAGGAVVATGGAALVVLGTGAAVYAAFSYYDETQDRERIRLTLDDLKTRKGFPTGGSGTQRFQVMALGTRPAK